MKTKATILFVSYTNDLEIQPDLVKVVWNMISPESPANKNLKKSKTGRIRTTASGEDLIFFIRGNEILHFSPNYNIELIYGGIGEKRLISCERS